jgi:membrane-associated phospholipid phosphatase
MQEICLPPTEADLFIAKKAARYTNARVQKCARAITWAADGKVLFAASAVLWVLSRQGNAKQRILADHLLATVVVANAIPHAIKNAVDQERPDRCMVGTDRRGVRESGKPLDAFPSGHGVHIGAVASALSWMDPKKAYLVGALAAVVATTRVAVLAHWASDVVAGLSMGVAIERALRRSARRRIQALNERMLPGSGGHQLRAGND